MRAFISQSKKGSQERSEKSGEKQYEEVDEWRKIMQERGEEGKFPNIEIMS